MEALDIRDMRAADLPEVADIWNAMIRDTTATFTTVEKSQPALAAWLSDAGPGRPRLSMRAAGRLIGFGAIGPFRAGPGYLDVGEHTVILAPGALRRGAGRALLRGLEARARDGGLTILVAGISGDNAGAIAFHAAMGYRQVARMPGVGAKFGRRLDLILMQKTL